MEENIKVSHIKNMNKFNFNSTLNISIDANASIKSIVDVDSYTFDHKVECVNGKAIISGKIGVKVLYLDNDNMTNNISDTTTFSETIQDSLITSDTYLNISNVTIVNDVLSTDGTLKISCDINILPIAYVNLTMSPPLNLQDSLITKKSELSTSSISQFINTKFEHNLNLETKNSINKILCNNSYFTAEKVYADDGVAIVEGKIVTYLLYETIKDDEKQIKELKDETNIKCDVEINGLTRENNLDLTFSLDKSKCNISTEIEDDSSVITITNHINVCGVSLKNVTINFVDDLFSLDNEVETTTSKREYNSKSNKHFVCETISNETSLSSDDPAIDDVVANLNITPEITNTYIKEGTIYLEGVITSNLIFIDENKELKHKQVEIPFILNSKIESETLGCVHSEITVVNNKVKIKRGTIIEMEYSLCVNIHVYQKISHEMVDNFKIGKQLDFSKYDFQIFIAKPGETIWELCKRIKISPNDIPQFNKDLPLVMEGGEKIVIKR